MKTCAPGVAANSRFKMMFDVCCPQVTAQGLQLAESTIAAAPSAATAFTTLQEQEDADPEVTGDDELPEERRGAPRGYSLTPTEPGIVTATDLDSPVHEDDDES